jgi:hypothetical protein
MRDDNRERAPGWVIGCSVVGGLLGLAAVGLMAVISLSAVRASRNASELPPPSILEAPEDGALEASVPEGGTKPQLPSGAVDVGGVSVTGGEVPNAARVVVSMRAGFRMCYRAELKTNPQAKGAMALTLTIGPNGEVSNVTATMTGELNATVTCCKARAMAAQFEPPNGGSAQVSFSLRCEPRE